MRRALLLVITWVFYLLGWIWLALDVLGRSEVFVKLPTTVSHVQQFIVAHQELGYQIAPWALMGLATLSLALVQWPHALRAKDETHDKSANSDLPTHAAATEVSPKTLREYFDSDFNHCLRTHLECKVTSVDGKTTTIPLEWCNDFAAGAKYLKLFIAHSPESYDDCKALTAILPSLPSMRNMVEVTAQLPGDLSHTNMNDLQFSGRVYVYHEDWFSLAQLGELETIYKSKGLLPQFRGGNYVSAQWLQERQQALSQQRPR